jgi:hypothetical protein
MPLKRMFEQRIESLNAFMLDPEQWLLCIRCDGDVKDLVLKLLAGLERQPDNPHLMIPCDTAFRSGPQFFGGLLEEVRAQYDMWKSQLNAAGIRFDFAAEEWKRLPADQRFLHSVSAFSTGLPESLGALVLLLDPQEIGDLSGFRQALAFLAACTKTPWLKYMVFDRKTKPRLEALEEEAPGTAVLTFSLDPADIEKQVETELRVNKGLKPTERRQYTAMLAAFAFAHKDYAKAQKLQEGWVNEVATSGPPAEAANALYNLGNTLLAKKDYPAAEETLAKALKLATDHQLKPMLPLILTNLGVALYRQKWLEGAEEHFRAARKRCQEQKLRPLEAHVLDLWAQTYQADKKPAQAEECWLEALALYDGITAEHFAPMREGGRTDILDKLEQHYQATRQKDKLNKLKQHREAKV